MRDGGINRAARTVSLALVAGLVAFESVLAVTAGVVGIPGLLLVQLREPIEEQTGGGESIVPKQWKQTVGPAAASTGSAEPTIRASLPQSLSLPIPALASVGARAAAPTPPPVVVDQPVITSEALAAPEASDAAVRATANPVQDPPKNLDLTSDPSSLEQPDTEVKPAPRQTLRDTKPTEDLPWEATVPVPLSELLPNRDAKSAK